MNIVDNIKILISILLTKVILAAEQRCSQWYQNNRTILVQTHIMGISLFVDGFDQGKSSIIRQRGDYNQHIDDMLIKYIENRKNIIHVGSHVGLETLSLAQHAKNQQLKDIKILAFQPNQFNYILLTKSVYLNDLQDIIEVLKVGAWEKEGQGQIAIKFMDTSAAQIVYGRTTQRKADQKYMVKTVTIDNTLRNKNIPYESIGIVYVTSKKMEIQVLIGMENLLKYNKQVVVLIDWTVGRSSHKRVNQIIQIFISFKDKGYKIFQAYLNPDTLILQYIEMKESAELINMEQCYILFLPNGKGLPIVDI